jgi:hypothetical protein
MSIPYLGPNPTAPRESRFLTGRLSCYPKPPGPLKVKRLLLRCSTYPRWTGSVPPTSSLGLQQWRQMLARVGLFHLSHFLRRSFHDDTATTRSTFRAEIDDPVSGLYYV